MNAPVASVAAASGAAVATEAAGAGVADADGDFACEDDEDETPGGMPCERIGPHAARNITRKKVRP